MTDAERIPAEPADRPTVDRPTVDRPIEVRYEPWGITLGELDERMGVEIVEESIDRVVCRMPVAGNRQSHGLLHGGASLAVAEAVGSWAAVIHASTLGKVAVGVDASGTHHASARDGWVRVTATPIKLGRTLTSHDVIVEHEETGERLCSFRITNAVIDRRIPGHTYVPVTNED